jgi:hypothetical protein
VTAVSNTPARPAEGYDPDAGTYIKAFSLGAPLSALPLEQIAAHPLTAGYPRGAAQVAAGAGCPPVTVGTLVHAEADGENKTLLFYAVPIGGPVATGDDDD